MKKILIFALFTVILNPIFGQEKDNTDKAVQEKPVSPEMMTLQLGTALAKYGYANKSGLALLQAADILSQFNLREAKLEKSETSKVVDDKKVSKPVELDTKKIIADAKSFANGNKSELAMIKEVEKKMDAPKTRGRVYGAARAYRRVEGYSSNTDYILFEGYSLAEIVISGDGDTDLDLYVYDENDNLVASSTNYTDYCHVSFIPRRTASFRLKVINRGSIHNNYTLLTN